MFRMPRFEEPGQVVDGCSPEQRDHPVHPVILSKKVRSGPVVPSKPRERCARRENADRRDGMICLTG